MTIEQLQREAYETACEKGWHDQPMRAPASDWCGDEPAPMIINHDRVLRSHALVHTELTEADDCWEVGEFDMYIDPQTGKPEGLVVEIADAVIRVADTCGALGLDLSSAVAQQQHDEPWTRAPFTGHNLYDARKIIDSATESVRVDDWSTYTERLAKFVLVLAGLCNRHGLDLAAALAAKMAYNKTRPRRHGGKNA